MAEAERPADQPKLRRKELVEAAWRRTEANCPVLVIFKEPIPVKVDLEIV